MITKTGKVSCRRVINDMRSACGMILSLTVGSVSRSVFQDGFDMAFRMAFGPELIGHWSPLSGVFNAFSAKDVQPSPGLQDLLIWRLFP